MALTETPICDFGWKAVDFSLCDADGRTCALADVRGTKGTLVMFICNHCPYVRAVIDRIVRDVAELQPKGIGAIAIMSNDWEQYPEDAPDKMKQFADTHGFTFPYVIDRDQQVARAYGAVCTPDFFGFNADLELQYRGRLDSSRRDPAGPDARRELFEAMCGVAETGKGPEQQIASMGCSIKWRDGSVKAAARRLIHKVGL
ncbi:MAG: thioredoxin family protein [Rhodospirillales bacterium]|nr:thioredoxin family protein [Rhodospirillales bacterium]